MSTDAIQDLVTSEHAALTQENQQLRGELKDAEERHKALAELLGKAYGEFAKVMDERDDARREIERLHHALKQLYDETADYITVNHLGDVHHNKSMRDARAALSTPKPC